jgi:hypothetical protein
MLTKKTAAKKSPRVRKSPGKLAPRVDVNRRREWRFKLPLNAMVEGRLPRGRRFKETAKLKNISSGGAYFCLDSGLVVGSKLNLVIDLPEEATEGRRLRLQLGGIAVRLEKPDNRGKKQGVAVRFSKKFRFLRGGPKKNV